jgi:hypothetical protein
MTNTNQASKTRQMVTSPNHRGLVEGRDRKARMNSARAQLVFLLAARSARLRKLSPKADLSARINAAIGSCRQHFQGVLPEPSGMGYELLIFGRQEARLAVWLLHRAGLRARYMGERLSPIGVALQVVAVDGEMAIAAE